MAKWEVWNIHKDGLTHKEVYKGDKIEIPAGKFILMDYDEAVQFKSQFFPMKKNGQGVQTPESMKMIALRKHVDGSNEEREQKVYVSHVDGKELPSQSALDAYLKQFEGQQIVDEAAEEEIKAEEAIRSRGRPRKV